MNEQQIRTTYGMEGLRDPESIAAAYLPRVERVALHMADTYGLSDPSELVSASHVALWETIQRYDPRKADLHRYIMVTVRQRLLDAIRKQSPLDHRQWQRLSRLRQTVRELEDELGRPPSDEEIMGVLGITQAKLDDLYRMEAQVSSPVPLDLGEVEDQSLAVADSVALKTTLEAALAKLPDREQRILYAVYVAGYSTEEIGQVLGLEASWVRRLRGRALAMLRAELTEPENLSESRSKPGALAKKESEEDEGEPAGATPEEDRFASALPSPGEEDST
jgi:RNA polymerase sigma factor for flagellar operon FliA